jgi:hypothetical protein
MDATMRVDSLSCPVEMTLLSSWRSTSRAGSRSTEIGVVQPCNRKMMTPIAGQRRQRFSLLNDMALALSSNDDERQIAPRPKKLCIAIINIPFIHTKAC